MVVLGGCPKSGMCHFTRRALVCNFLRGHVMREREHAPAQGGGLLHESDVAKVAEFLHKSVLREVLDEESEVRPGQELLIAPPDQESRHSQGS